MARRNGMSEAARELKLFIDNDGQLYRQQFEPILKNLMTKVGRGTYDSAKSVKLWGYLCESGAKKYAKEFGGTWNHIFTVADRKQCAEALRDDFEAEAKQGNYDALLPKKYRAKKNPRKPSKATVSAAKRAASQVMKAAKRRGPPGYWTEAEIYWELRGISLIINWGGQNMFFQGDDAYYALENLGVNPDDVSKVPSLFEVPETVIDEYAHLNWDRNPAKKPTKRQLVAMIDRSEFLSAYFEAALWAETAMDTDDERDDRSYMDKGYTVDDFTVDALISLIDDADKFLGMKMPGKGSALVMDITMQDPEQAGHDFWLTRQGTGAGFGDGDWPEPEATFLEEAAQKIGQVWLVGGKGRISVSR